MGQPARREEPEAQRKAAAFVRWHEPNKSRGLRSVLWGARGESPRAYSAEATGRPAGKALTLLDGKQTCATDAIRGRPDRHHAAIRSGW